MEKLIYLDHHATTPVDRRVFEAMAPYFCEHFGNAASSGHSFGWKAQMAVSKARKQVADLIGAQSQEIYFTSGATESNNWALFGLLEAQRKLDPGQLFHIITSNAEHSSTLSALHRAAEAKDVDLTILKVNRFGRVELEQVKAALKDNTLFMSFIFGNNEIGTLNPVAELGALAKERKIIFHSDAAQCSGHVAMDVEKLGVDMMSLASHKMYGPKGAGALYIRSQNPKVTLRPLIEGGGQEKGLRSGTLNVPGIVGLGQAAELAMNLLDTEVPRLKALRDGFFAELKKHFPRIHINGDPVSRLPNNLNVTIPELDLQSLLPAMSHLAVSSGSACASGSMSMSHVLQAIGLSQEEAKHTLRFGLGRSTTRQELDQVIEGFLAKVSKRIELSTDK